MKLSARVSIVVNLCGVVAAIALLAACGDNSSKAQPSPTSAGRKTSTSVGAIVTQTTDASTARSTARSSAPSTTPPPPPPGLSGRIELPSPTLVAGATEPGMFVIWNNTNAPVALTTAGPVPCKPGWAVILTSAALPQEAAFASSCVPHALVVPVGQTRLPFRLRSDYQTCSETGSAQGALMPPCVKDAKGVDASPPLPSGDYRATFFSDISRFIPVESVPVHVVAAG